MKKSEENKKKMSGKSLPCYALKGSVEFAQRKTKMMKLEGEDGTTAAEWNYDVMRKFCEKLSWAL